MPASQAADRGGFGLLLISASDYHAAVTKGVAAMLSEFDEGGFFDRVLIAFPLTRRSETVRVSPTVVAVNIGADWMGVLHRARLIRRASAPIHLTRAIFAMAMAVRRQNLTVVRATDPCFAGLIGWAVARLSGRPFCVSIHADFDLRHRLGGRSAGTTVLGSRRIAKLIERFVFSRADRIMPIRETLERYALEGGARREKIRVIPHGTDLTPFLTQSGVNVRQRFDLPAEKKMLSFAGRLVAENYVDDVLELARRLAESRRDFVLLIAGGGLEEQRLQQTVTSDPRLCGVVRLIGFQRREVVGAIRQASLASLCLMGGFSLIEACAAGSAPIAYDIEWHRELVIDAETGKLVPEGDVHELTTATNWLLDHPELAAKLGQAARARAVSRHDIKVTVAIKRRCYQELIDERTCAQQNG